MKVITFYIEPPPLPVTPLRAPPWELLWKTFTLHLRSYLHTMKLASFRRLPMTKCWLTKGCMYELMWLCSDLSSEINGWQTNYRRIKVWFGFHISSTLARIDMKAHKYKGAFYIAWLCVCVCVCVCVCGVVIPSNRGRKCDTLHSDRGRFENGEGPHPES